MTKGLGYYFFRFLEILKYIIFFGLVIVSASVSAFLFSSLGITPLYKWVFAGLAFSFEFLKGYSLVLGVSYRDWSVFEIDPIKKKDLKKKSWFWLGSYGLVALSSMIASLAFTLSSAEALDAKNKSQEENSIIVTLEREVSSIEERIKILIEQRTILQDHQKKSIEQYDNQLRIIQSQPNPSSAQINRLLASRQRAQEDFMTKFEQLTSQINSLYQAQAEVESKLREARLSLQNEESSTFKEAFVLLGELFSLGERTTLVLFLMILAFLIEYFTVVSSPHLPYNQVFEVLGFVEKSTTNPPPSTDNEKNYWTTEQPQQRKRRPYRKRKATSSPGEVENSLEANRPETRPESSYPVIPDSQEQETITERNISPPLKDMKEEIAQEHVPPSETPLELVGGPTEEDGYESQEEKPQRISLTTPSKINLAKLYFPRAESDRLKKKRSQFLNLFLENVTSNEPLKDPYLVGSQVGLSSDQTEQILDELRQKFLGPNKTPLLENRKGKWYSNFNKEYILDIMREENNIDY